MCTVFLDRAGSCEGTQLERGMCRLACFHWNVACIVSQTINRCLLAFLLLLFTSFPFETPQVQTEVMLMDSCPKRSSRSLWWPQRRDGSAASGMHEWASQKQNELSAGAVSLREQQCVNLCFALMNYKKENPVNAFMFWRWNIDMMKRNCSTVKSCLAARRQSTEIIPPRKTVFRSGRRWYCIFRQHNSQIRNLVTTFTSLFLN